MEMHRPLRLLHVASRFYAEPTNGAELRNYYLGTRLALHMEVTHVGFTHPGRRIASDDPGNPRHRLVPVPRENPYRVADLLRGIAGHVPFSVLNYSRKEMRHALQYLLKGEAFDIVQLEGVHLGEYLPLLRQAPNPPRAVVCDWHNIESEILWRYAETAGNPARRLYARLTAAKLEKYEREFVNECDLHVTVSDRDRETLIRYGVRAPVIVIENGIPVERFGRKRAGEALRRRFRVVFVGAMDYHANTDAVLFFGREVWPLIHGCLPEAAFTIVGRDPPPEVRSLGAIAGVEVTGTVADVRPYYEEAFVAVAPLRVAGGTRIKILEAMASGVPVVSTARGAEGLAAVPGAHYILAETAEAMRDAVAELFRDTVKATRLTQAGRELVRQRYDWAALGDALAKHLVFLAAAPGRAAASGAAEA